MKRKKVMLLGLTAALICSAAAVTCSAEEGGG